MAARKSNYDKFPVVAVPQGENACVAGWENCAGRLRQAIAQRQKRKTVLVVECYPGVDEKGIREQLKRLLSPALLSSASDSLLTPEKIDALVAPFLGGNDPVFGFLSDLALPQFK